MSSAESLTPGDMVFVWEIEMSHNHIVLFEPRIPQNTGNIAACAATNSLFISYTSYGLSSIDKKMKRAGLDYWDKLDILLWQFGEFHV